MGKPLYEKYRPSTWGEVVGQDDTVKRLRAMAQRDSLSGRAYWLSGGSGQGKTTIARLIASDVADEFCINEVDAGSLTLAQLKLLEQELQTRGWGDKPGRAVLINEAHGLRKDVIRQLLVVLERIPGHAVWAFTTTADNQAALFEDCLDASPLLSRCIHLPLETGGPELVSAFGKRVVEIARAEKLWGKDVPEDTIEGACYMYRCNFRELLQKVECGTWA